MRDDAVLRHALPLGRGLGRWPIGGLGLLIFIMVPNLVQKCWSTPKLWQKNEIQNGGRRHLEFTFGGNFWHTADFPLLISTITQNLVPISQSAADLRYFFRIQDGGRPPSWVFENLISDQWVALGCWFSIMVQNLVQKMMIDAQIMAQNEIQNGGRRHLEFISIGYYWHTATFHC